MQQGASAVHIWLIALFMPTMSSVSHTNADWLADIFRIAHSSTEISWTFGVQANGAWLPTRGAMWVRRWRRTRCWDGAARRGITGRCRRKCTGASRIGVLPVHAPQASNMSSTGMGMLASVMWRGGGVNAKMQINSQILSTSLGGLYTWHRCCWSMSIARCAAVCQGGTL